MHYIYTYIYSIVQFDDPIQFDVSGQFETKGKKRIVLVPIRARDLQPLVPN